MRNVDQIVGQKGSTIRRDKNTLTKLGTILLMSTMFIFLIQSIVSAQDMNITAVSSFNFTKLYIVNTDTNSIVKTIDTGYNTVIPSYCMWILSNDLKIINGKMFLTIPGFGGPDCPRYNDVKAIDPNVGSINDIITNDAPSSLKFYNGKLYVLNSFGHSIQEIDPATNTILRTIPFTNPHPGYIGDPIQLEIVNDKIYLPFPSGNYNGILQILDLNTGTLLTTIDFRDDIYLMFFYGPLGIKQISDDKVYVSDDYNNIAVINTTTDTVSKYVTISQYYDSGPLSITTSSGKAYIDNDIGTISVIDLSTDTLIKEIDIGLHQYYGHLTGIASLGDKVYVTDENIIRIIDAKTDTYIGDINMPITVIAIDAATVVLPNTPSGTNVKVNPDDNVTVTFSSVSTSGNTTVTPVTNSPPKEGYKLGSVYFDITTTATYSGPITICLKYDDVGMSDGVEKNLRLEHWLVDSQGHGSYVDITIPGDINHPNPDTDNNIICGSTYTLSPFGIAWDITPNVSSITAPIDPVAINTPVSVSASFNDPTAMDTHSAVWDWGDGTTSPGTINENIVSGTVTDSHTYTQPGVYTIILTVNNKDGGKGTSTYQYVVVYDPNGGFVTGGGWIDSPAGAYTANSSLTGKANFGFVSKYQKGATTIPTGSTEFQFKVANLNFQSNTYEWLVIAGARAQYKGNGTINGTGDYEFMLTAIDGQISGGGGTDKFRIKIWDKNNADAVIYDNQLGATDDAMLTTVIQGGSIVIHS